MENLEQKFEERTLFGSKVGALRRSGKTPANIYGHSIESQAIQADTNTLEKILAKAGSTHMITLKSSSSRKGHKVLVKEVQRNPITGALIHIDFHEVKMTDKVKVEVPLVLTGEAPAAGRKDLLLLENIRTVEVECLPDEIPESIPIDLSEMDQAGDHITVRNLQLSDNIHILTHPEEVIVRVEMARTAVTEEEEVEAEEEMAEETAAADTPEEQS